MKQEDFFTEPVDLDAEIKKLHRSSHPDTSRKAAEHIVKDLPKLHAYVLGAVLMNPGMTANELAQRYSERDPRRIGRRLIELERSGHVTRGPHEKICRVTGRPATVWFPSASLSP